MSEAVMEISRVDLSGLRILVVDDEEDMVMVLSESLVLLGAEAITATTAQQAMEVIRSGAVDVLISDLGMPGIDGLSLIAAVRELETKPPVAIALTGHARAEDAKISLAAGFDAHVAKPVGVTDLAESIRRLCEAAATGR